MIIVGPWAHILGFCTVIRENVRENYSYECGFSVCVFRIVCVRRVMMVTDIRA